jgi:hypothetical protein
MRMLGPSLGGGGGFAPEEAALPSILASLGGIRLNPTHHTGRRSKSAVESCHRRHPALPGAPASHRGIPTMTETLLHQILRNQIAIMRALDVTQWSIVDFKNKTVTSPTNEESLQALAFMREQMNETEKVLREMFNEVDG